MLTWGFLLLVGGFIGCLIFFLSQMSDIFNFIGTLGFGGYVEAFFNPANVNTGKVTFMITLALTILGLVLYIIGRVKNKGEKNPIVPEKVKKYLRDTKGEFKKIVWPNFSTVVRNTGVVLAMCAVVGLLVIVVDYGLSALVTWLVGLNL